MNKITKSIKVFKSVILPTIAQKYRPYADQVISLFADRKIEKTKEAEKLLVQLSSRGLGPQSAIDKITKKNVIQESITGRLSRPTSDTFFISGVIKSSMTYKNQLKKTGTSKEQTYILPDEPYMLSVKAKNRAEAEEKYFKSAKEHYNVSRPSEDYNKNKIQKFNEAVINIFSGRSTSSFNASSENSQFMKASSPVEYSLSPLM